jgi:hypothetical protein
VEAYSSKNGAVCGWCEPFGTGKNKTNGTCWEGTAAGPFYKSVTANETCAQKHWGLDSKICGTHHLFPSPCKLLRSVRLTSSTLL